MKKKSILFIAIPSITLIIFSIVYKVNFINTRHLVWEVRKAGTVAALEIKSRITGSSEVPVCVPVLMYHSVNNNPPGDPEISVTYENFEQQMKYLAENGYSTIDFDELKDAGKNKKPIIITFDDGYEDNYTNAYPILKKYNLKATIFMVSGYIGAPGFLTEKELCAMDDIVSIQSHTVSHKPLSSMSESEINNELSVSKDAINKVTNKPVYAISYPNGAHNATVLKVASQYYNYAVVSPFGYYFSDISNYAIQRIAVSQNEGLSKFISDIT